MAKEKPTKERRTSKRTDKPASVIYFDDQKCLTRNLSEISSAGGKQIKILIRARINRGLSDSEEIALPFLSLDDSACEIPQNIMAGRV